VLDLEGKIALVTGAGSGIGRATAMALASAGAMVVVSDVDRDSGELTAREIGGSASFRAADVSRASDVAALVEHAIERHGRIDCAVNNAGVLGALGPTAEQMDRDFDRTLRTNFKGVWLSMKNEIPRMLERGSGVIVNVSSINGIKSATGAPIYSASKHAVIGLTRSAAIEYAPKGIRINAVCPGAFMTPLLERSIGGAEGARRLQELIPARRTGELEEIARVICFLCSSASSYVIGAEIVVDGGLLARAMGSV
jgi:NAD(P)-dependent dehydrogenase (short-subunit alcohol dehydrogenase family)